MKNSGYTLIELVIVMGLLVIVGGLITGILSTALRGSTKTRVKNDLAQNGNYAMSLMTDLLNNSKNFNYINTLPELIPTPYPILDCSLKPSGKAISFTGFDGGTSTLICDDTASTISSHSATSDGTVYKTTSLLDESQVKLVPGTCSFSCNQTDVYSSPRIDITFQLQNLAGATVETKGSTSFSTSVSVRNFNLR